MFEYQHINTQLLSPSNKTQTRSKFPLVFCFFIAYLSTSICPVTAELLSRVRFVSWLLTHSVTLLHWPPTPSRGPWKRSHSAWSDLTSLANVHASLTTWLYLQLISDTFSQHPHSPGRKAWYHSWSHPVPATYDPVRASVTWPLWPPWHQEIPLRPELCFTFLSISILFCVLNEGFWNQLII